MAGDATVVLSGDYTSVVASSCKVRKERGVRDRPFKGELARLPFNYQLPQTQTGTIPDGQPGAGDPIFETVAEKYFKWNRSDVVEMTTAEKALVDGKQTSDESDKLDKEANVSNFNRRERAIVEWVIDEINLLRQNAAIGDPERTSAQVRARLKNKLSKF